MLNMVALNNLQPLALLVQINVACEKTKIYFESLINQLKDHDVGDDGMFYVAFNANEESYREQYYFAEDYTYDDAYNQAVNKGASISVIQNSNMAGHEQAIMIKQSYIIAMFKQFFNAA